MVTIHSVDTVYTAVCSVSAAYTASTLHMLQWSCSVHSMALRVHSTLVWKGSSTDCKLHCWIIYVNFTCKPFFLILFIHFLLYSHNLWHYPIIAAWLFLYIFIHIFRFFMSFFYSQFLSIFKLEVKCFSFLNGNRISHWDSLSVPVS